MSVVKKEAESNTCHPAGAFIGAAETLVDAIESISELRLIPGISDEILKQLDNAKADLAWTAGYMSAMVSMLRKD